MPTSSPSHYDPRSSTAQTPRPWLCPEDSHYSRALNTGSSREQILNKCWVNERRASMNGSGGWSFPCSDKNPELRALAWLKAKHDFGSSPNLNFLSTKWRWPFPRPRCPRAARKIRDSSASWLQPVHSVPSFSPSPVMLLLEPNSIGSLVKRWLFSNSNEIIRRG